MNAESLSSIRTVINEYLIRLADTKRDLKRDATGSAALMIWQKSHKDDPQALEDIIARLEDAYAAIWNLDSAEDKRKSLGYKEV